MHNIGNGEKKYAQIIQGKISLHHSKLDETRRYQTTSGQIPLLVSTRYLETRRN